jgi:hypothetical protein
MAHCHASLSRPKALTALSRGLYKPDLTTPRSTTGRLSLEASRNAMKNIFALIIVAAASLPSLGFQTAAGDWIKFTSDAGRFSVLMPGPGEPKDDAKTTTDSRIGPYTTHLFLQKTDKGLFLAGWVDYAPGVRLDVQGELAANRENFVKGLDARVTSEHAVKLGDSPGVEFVAENADATFKSRVYVVGRRPYMIAAVTFKGLDDSANVEKFLASFQVKTPGK